MTQRMAAAILLLLSIVLVLTGCWDSKELEQQFILTGISLDVAEDPNKISVTAQVANIKKEESGSGDGAVGDATIVINTTGDSLMACLTEMNRNSNHNLLFHHNQIRLFGIELAEQGIKKHLDMIMRDQKVRLEVPLAIVDGRGEDALTANLSHAPISGIFLGGMFSDLAEMSVKYRVRLIDLVHRFLDDAAAPVIPIIQVTPEDENGKQEIKLTGMAIFQDDKMIGRLTNEQTMGYIWSFGDVQECHVAVEDESGRAGLDITRLECKREVALGEDGGVKVSLKIDANVELVELYGFKEMKPPALLKHLEGLAQKEIEDRIKDCFATAKELNADIFEFCTMVYKKYPKQWDQMKGQWGEIFSQIDLTVEAKANIPRTGQIVQSLEMEENME